jgi:predicted amidohydrolase
MTVPEIKQIKDLAIRLINENHSKKESKERLIGAGIIDEDGKIKKPYDKVFSYKK